jgi:hypothetical protein
MFTVHKGYDQVFGIILIADSVYRFNPAILKWYRCPDGRTT